MAGHSFLIQQPGQSPTRCFVDYADGEGEAVVNGRKWRWEFHDFCGPSFLKKNGDPRDCQPGEKHPVWKAFNKWFKKYEKSKLKKGG